MKLRSALWAVLVLVVALFVACGGSSTTSDDTGDAANDASGDVTMPSADGSMSADGATDATKPSEGGTDGSTIGDAATDVHEGTTDATANDGSTVHDSGTDATANDGSTVHDSGTDAIATDGSTDAAAEAAAPTLVSIAVTPAAPSINVGATQQFVAKGTYSDNSVQVLTNQVTWASDTPLTATINAAGLATGNQAGTTSITASLDGVVSPGDTLTVTGLYVLHFQRSANGVVTIPATNATLNNRTLYTMEGWISEDAPGGGTYMGLLSQDFGGCCLIRMLIDPSLDPFVNTGAHVDVAFDHPMAAPAWHHFAMGCSGGTTTVWVDGTNVGTTPCTDPGNMAGSAIYLGTGEAGTAWRLTGRIGEVRISNIVRYTAAFTPQKRFTTDANTTLLLHFDEGSGTTVHDSSGNSNDGAFSATGVSWVADDR